MSASPESPNSLDSASSPAAAGHVLPERIRVYLNKGLAGAPAVAAHLLDGVTDAELDRRPDPDRFTIREALAHIADWEGVWRERLEKIAREDNPLLPGYDEGQWAIDHDYAHSDPQAELARYAAGRAALCAFVKSLAPEDYARSGRHGEIGRITIADLLTLVLAHDNYHLLQFTEFRNRSVGA